MRLVSLSLRNYRVYDTLDLELPPGLVGIYGPNGSGKSTLLESIGWTLYGRARTAKGEIRTSQVDGECSAELDFEHEGHHYRVRRWLTGRNATVKARMWSGNAVAAEGPTDVGRYVRSILGMDDQAFRSSVFAEQKQLAAFSDQSPEHRRRLVLALLGITPLERARDRARSDARQRRADHDRVALLLPSGTDRDIALEQAEARFKNAQAACAAAAENEAAARTVVDHRRGELAKLSSQHTQYERIRTEGATVRASRDRARDRTERLAAELETLRIRTALIPDLEIRSQQQRELESVVELLTRHRQAIIELGDLPSVALPESPPEDALAEFQREATESAAAAAVAEHGHLGAQQALRTAERALKQSQLLAPEEPCPTCGQALGSGFLEVQRHRTADVALATASVTAAEQELRAAQARSSSAKRRSSEALSAAQKLRAARERAVAAAAQRESALARLTSAATRVEQALALVPRLSPVVGVSQTEPRLPGDGGRADLEWNARTLSRFEPELTAARQAARDLDGLVTLLGEIPRREAELASASAEQSELDAKRTALLAELETLAFRPDEFARVQQAFDVAAAEHERVLRAATDCRVEQARADEALLAARAAQREAREQRDAVAQLERQARLLARTADLLHGFRQAVVAAIGPTLQTEASSLFNLLTGGDYDGLDVDPETYAMQIIDQGQPYPLERFSGSEVDLANLALRVAISEHLRFQSGGQIGLLILDEALASLDSDRKDRMLSALTNLSGRFSQILVVTHAPEVKEQLPAAIEVVKLPGRRARATIIDA